MNYQKKGNSILLIFIISIWMVPIIWMFIGSFLPHKTIIGIVPFNLSDLTFQNFISAFNKRDWISALVSSIAVSSFSVIIILILASTCAFGLSRNPVQQPKFILWLLSTRILPAASFLLPLFIAFQIFDLIDTWISLIIGNILINLGLMVILIKSYIDKIDKAFDEYLMIKGYTNSQILIKTFASKIRSPFILIAILCFLLSWNEFFFATSFTAAGQSQTLPVVVSGFITNQEVLWGQMFASCLILILPAMVAIWLLEKAILKGFTYNLIEI